VPRFARELTEAVARVAGVERANVWLFNEAETELRCIDSFEATPKRHTAGAVLAEMQYANEFHALKSARYVDASDPLTDPRTAGYVEGYVKPLGITSMLDAVIQVSGRHLGLLCLEHVGKAHRWEQDEIAFACQLADKVALAVTLREHRQAQEAMRESEARFRAMIEQSISGNCIVGPDGRLVYANPRLAAILGYENEAALVGLPVLDLVAPEDRERIAGTLRRHMDGAERGVRYHFDVLRPDGTRVTLGAQGTAGSYAGKHVVIVTAQDVTELLRAEEEIKGYLGKLERAMDGTLEVVSKMVELRDPYTRGHERRVAELCAALGQELGLPADRIEGLRVAGSVHDVGKIAVPAEILSKPTRLTPTEYALVKDHAQLGYEILNEVEFSWPVAQATRQHHERLDGSGYPNGLKGEQIILEARILAVADTLEAMSSHRPYRPGLGLDKALAEIERGRGRIYDLSVADACLKLFREKGYTLPA
jgi:PAS domain S-box-containing protein